MKKILLLIAAVIAVSGCVGIPDVFGRDVISVQQSIVESGVRDVIVVRDIVTIPKSPLLPDQQVILSFVIENRDALKSARAYVDLFNAPTMRDGFDRPCNFYAVSGYTPNTIGIGTPVPVVGPSGQVAQNTDRFCLPDQCGPAGCVVLPGEEKPINFGMKTPTQEDIKNIKTQTRLDFKTTYNFDGSLNYIVPAVNADEITKRQRAGEKTNLFTTKSFGSGPVIVDVELQGAPYILDTYEAVMMFKIKNRGSGTLERSQIDSSSLQILFPPEFDVITAKSSEKFVCSPDPLTGGTICVNNAKKDNQDLGTIPLYRDESRSSLRFTVQLRQPMAEPFRSYPISAQVSYKYELRNSVDLTINPFNNF
ncbi:MAG: hypothetical protein HY517_02275 [Candidatus Aenigmarchaeota archaeon]|nr:hypothetical protein [Candidatus Aenigmarchaeota archaeon]